MNMITTTQAARKLGVSERRVRALIKGGRIKANRFGRVWAILEESLEAVKYRKSGRPKNEPQSIF